MTGPGAEDKSTLGSVLESQRFIKLAHRLLAATMLTCLFVPLILILGRLFPNWQGAYLLPLVFLVALESFYSHYRLRSVNIIAPEWWYARLAEFVVLLILTRLLIYAVHGFGRLWIELPLWREDFLASFFTLEYLLAVTLIGVVWVLSGELQGIFSDLEGDEALLAIEFDIDATRTRVDARQRLVNLVIVSGGLMTAGVALLNLENETSASGGLVVRQGAAALLVYFTCSLALLSLTQYAILRVRWLIGHIRIDASLTRRWFALSLLVIVLLAGIAFLLPTGYSRNLLGILQLGLAYLLNIVLNIAYFLTLPFILLISWIMSLFKGKSDPLTPLPRPTFYPPPELVQGQGPGWQQALKSILLWLTLVGLVGYAFVYYVRENPALFRWARGNRFVSGLGRFWRWLASRALGVNQRIASAVQNGRQRMRRRAPGALRKEAWKYANPRKLPPGEQMIFYYLALVRRGAEKGLPRAASQTPLEYSGQLKARLPDEVGQDIGALTDGFLEARYSRHEITPAEASRVRCYWENILKVLRKRD